MKRKLFSRLGDISKVNSRAAFSDVEQQIKKHKYGSDAFMSIVEDRYTCHAFNHYPVSASKLQMILDAGRMAPSEHNCQPVHIWVVKEEEALERLRKVHPCYGAPVVLVVGSKKEEAWVRGDGKNAAETDAAIVLTHLMLTATDARLANAWIGDFDPALLHQQLPETDGYEVYSLLAIGHPAANGKPTDLHEIRKPLEEIVTEL